MKTVKGRVWKFGDNIDTDVIFPSQYMLLPTIDDMKAHAFEPLMEGFSEKVKAGDIIVAGENFGCGSSREQAPAVLKALGIDCIIAKSFARIFYRNAINLGLPAIVNKECHATVKEGDIVVVDLKKHTITFADRELTFREFPSHIIEMISVGGLIESINGKDKGISSKGSCTGV